MATSSNSGGGFSIGVIYGLLVSTTLYLVLCFLFPVTLVNANAPQGESANVDSAAPVIAESVETPLAPVDPSQPLEPEMQVASMVQPDVGETQVFRLAVRGIPARPVW